MAEKIVAQGTVHCPILGGSVEVIVEEREGFFGTSTTKRLLCPYLYGHWNDCGKRKEEGHPGESCGIYKSLGCG